MSSREASRLRGSDELVSQLEELHEKLSPLHSATGLGFHEPDRRLLDEALAQVSSRKGWVFHDSRGKDSNAFWAQVQPSLGQDGTLVWVVDGKKPPTAVTLVARSFWENRRTLSWNGAKVERASAQSLFLLLPDCLELDEVAPELHEIPYWKFLR